MRSTFRPEVIGDIGGFGGLFQFPQHRFTHPVLVSSTDGVGTKAVVAQRAGVFESIGVDLVAMCVDDIACAGAEPLFFLDYIAVGKLDPDHIEQLVAGVAKGCREAGCALIGGEMAEHPGSMEAGEFDLVGFAVGVAERDRILDGTAIAAGRRPHRAAVAEPALQRLLPRPPRVLRRRRPHARRPGLGRRPPLARPRSCCRRRSSTPRPSPPSCGWSTCAPSPTSPAEASPGTSTGCSPTPSTPSSTAVPGSRPKVFTEIQRLGQVRDEEMAKVFNMGIGMIAVVPADEVYAALDVLRTAGHRAVQIGTVEPGHGHVRYA